MSTDKSLKKSDQEILEIAKKRFMLAVDAESEMREVALEDQKFCAGDQWPDDVKQARSLDQRPCLTINRLPQFVRQVTNDTRQNRPSIKVSPVDSAADIDTAKVFQGIIRHIEYNSNADVAYDTATDGQVTKGLGYFRLCTDYCDPSSFDLEIFIKRIRNSFSVYLDPHHQEPDGSDANWGFIFEDMAKEDYEAEYKNSKMAGMTDWASIGNQVPGWATNDTVRVAEYFFKEYVETTLVQLSTGEVLDLSKVGEHAVLPEGVTVKATRKARVPKVRWLKINAVEVLEETEWPGQWIPIIPVIGDERDVNGKRILEGVVRHAKDPQRMYNYWASAETETIALAPRAPFIGVEGQFEGHEDKWRTANVKNHAFLEYKPKSSSGQPAGPPMRQVYEPPVQAITQARMQSSEDLKATTGIYDAALGNRSNENSGIAIQRRNLQSQTSNFHFVDNLSRALRHLGRQLVDLIPKVYDTPRAVRTIGEDGEVSMVAINQVFQEGGQEKIHDLSAGKYDVTISTGPSYATKRQEAVASMLDMAKVAPQLMQLAPDIIVKNMDWPGNQEIADRLKKTLPPGIAEDKDKDQPIPPQIQAQMGQMNQMIEQLTQQLNAAHDAIDTKKLELDSRERIAAMQVEAQVSMKLAEVDSREGIALLQQEVAALKHQQQLLHSQFQFESQSTGPEGAEPNGTEQPTGGISPGQPVE